jgi:uncharacterized protein (DUF1015 family)
MNFSSSPSTDKMIADFRPFQAWRYNLDKINFEKVIAPPYDVISPEEQKKLYQVSDFNCIRLILNQEEPADTETRNRYTRARDFFNQWREKGILVRESSPCFYLYRQIFLEPVSGQTKTRFALLGRLKLESFEKQIVIPHEKTLSRPRADRRKLLETTVTNFSPVFGLYEDQQKKVSSLFTGITSAKPLFDVPDNQGVRHAVWPVSDPKAVEAIHGELSQKKIYIADGHHRYQTALEYGREKREKENVPAQQEMTSDFVLMALVEFHDPGLVLYPTHRLIVGWKDFDAKKAFESLKNIFKIEPVSKETVKSRILADTSTQASFGLVLGDEQFILTLMDPVRARQTMISGKPDVWYSLDVNVLAHLIFSKLWQIPETIWESTIQYTQSYDEAIRRVKAHEAQAAFLLKAPKVEVLRDMGRVQELMPQKSTYFFPKLASGLVFYHHNENPTAGH